MAVVSTPPFAPNSMYRPIVFQTMQNSTEPLVLAVASIIVNGSSVTDMRKSPYYASGGNYYFEFDVSKLLQTVSNPKSTSKTTVFPNTLNVPYLQVNNDIHAYVGLIISYYYNDPITGNLTQLDSGGPVLDIIPNGSFSIASTRQQNEYMGMDDYVMDGSVVRPALTNRKKSPVRYPMCTNENAYLTYIPNDDLNAFRVRTFKTVGGIPTMIDIGYATANSSLSFEPSTIGVGYQNLLTQTYIAGAVDMTDPTIEYYAIDFGKYTGTWTGYSVVYIYELVECCSERSTRLHFFNRLGGADSYTFTSRKKISQTNNSELAQKPLSWIAGSTTPTSSFDRGKFKINQTAEIVYEVESGFYDADNGAFLSEILSSPEVYMETTEGLVAVNIIDSEIVIRESEQLVNLIIQFVLAIPLSLQQN